MKKTAQPTSTQSFTEILEIQDSVVLLRGNAACTILRVTSVNFALQSAGEQDSKVLAYAALLNSLSFPIQIVVRSKPLYITNYLSTIDDVIHKTTNENLKTYMHKYKDFVGSLVSDSAVLDKQFYVVIPYSSLEGGVASMVSHTSTSKSSQQSFFEEAQASLDTKAESLLSQIHRLGLQATILGKDDLVKLFYDIYNQGEAFPLTDTDMTNPMVKGTQ